jgi:hypothetical protein
MISIEPARRRRLKLDPIKPLTPAMFLARISVLSAPANSNYLYAATTSTFVVELGLIYGIMKANCGMGAPPQ